MEQIVATVLGCLSWNLAFEVCDKLEGALHQLNDVLAFQVSFDEEVITCETTHRTPIYDAVFPLFVITEIGSSEVLDRVDGTVVETRLLIRYLHADIESSDHFVSNFVLTANVYTAEQLVMIDSKTWYLVHFNLNVKC